MVFIVDTASYGNLCVCAAGSSSHESDLRIPDVGEYSWLGCGCIFMCMHTSCGDILHMHGERNIQRSNIIKNI